MTLMAKKIIKNNQSTSNAVIKYAKTLRNN